MKEYPETHLKGMVSIENMPDELSVKKHDWAGTTHWIQSCDFGIQIGKDGRVWVCINGIAFLRFSPQELNGEQNE